MKKTPYIFRDIATSFTLLSLSIAFILILILSFGGRFFFRPGIDDSFWGDLAFLLAITIYALYFGIGEAKRYYEKKEQGRYQVALQEFKDIRKTVQLKDFTFDMWLDMYYRRSKREYYITLVSNRTSFIHEYILDLNYDEIDLLTQENVYKKEWSQSEYPDRQPTYFRKITKEQAEFLKKIYQGKYAFAKIPNGYFKTYDDKITDSEYKYHSEENKTDFWSTFWLIFYRVIFLIVTQIIFAIFGIKMIKAQSAEEALENAYNTFSRLFNLISGFSWGWMIGRILIIKKANKLDYKTRINLMFDNDRTFKTVDEQELARKEYENEHILKIPMFEEVK